MAAAEEKQSLSEEREVTRFGYSPSSGKEKKLSEKLVMKRQGGENSLSEGGESKYWQKKRNSDRGRRREEEASEGRKGRLW